MWYLHHDLTLNQLDAERRPFRRDMWHRNIVTFVPCTHVAAAAMSWR